VTDRQQAILRRRSNHRRRSCLLPWRLQLRTARSRQDRRGPRL